MGESQPTTIPLSFNQSLSIQAFGDNLTSLAGALPLRELDHRLAFSAWLARNLQDPRLPDACTHSTTKILRTVLYLSALRRGLFDDADELRDDPALRFAASDHAGLTPREEPGLPSQPTLSRVLGWLSTPHNLFILESALIEIVRRKLRARGRSRLRQVILDFDSFPVEAHGRQPPSAGNGYYHMRCFHPLVIFLANTSDIVFLQLRPGNVHTSKGATEQVLKTLTRIEAAISKVCWLRGDAGFPCEELLGGLEERGTYYALRIKTNGVLKRLAKPFLRRPAGRPPREPRQWFYELSYGAKEWSRKRRVVLVVQEEAGKADLHYFFLVTNCPESKKDGEGLLSFYRERGTMEGHLGQFNKALDPHLSSSPRPKSHYQQKPIENHSPSQNSEEVNAAKLLLFGLGYNLLNGLRELLNERSQRDYGWSLPALLTRALWVAGRLIVSGRRATFRVNQTLGQLWKKILRGLARLSPQPIDSS
jgi:Transposase DDE domain group 1